MLAWLCFWWSALADRMGIGGFGGFAAGVFVLAMTTLIVTASFSVLYILLR